MTNFEKIKEEIANMNEEEFYLWKIDRSPWCVDIEKKNNCRYGSLGCKACASQWLKSKYEEPMPELKTGMFVEYYDKCYENSPSIYNARGYGVVVGDKIVCQDGSCFYGLKEEDTINCITKVFNADYFNDCDDDTCIWEKDKC